MYCDRRAKHRATHKSTVEVKTNSFVKTVFIKQNISSGEIDYKITVTSNNLGTKMITIQGQDWWVCVSYLAKQSDGWVEEKWKVSELIDEN